MGVLIDNIADFIKIRNDRVRKYEFMVNEYAQIGFALFCILGKCKRDYLEKYLDYSEICYPSVSSTLNQYVYKLKLSRPLSLEEEKLLGHYLLVEYARMNHIDSYAFSRNVKIYISGDNIFYQKIGANNK